MARGKSSLSHPHACIALEEDEVERGREIAAADRGEESMRLATMMRLVIEEMGKRRAEGLRHLDWMR